MPERVYLDWNATAPLRPEARDAMIAAMDVVGNPSSVHTEGRAAKAIVEKAREQVAALVGCDGEEVVFTSGATEAATLAITSFEKLGYRVAAPETEHDCIFFWRHPDVDWAGSLNEAAEEFEYVEDIEPILFRGGWIVCLSPANGEVGVLRSSSPLADTGVAPSSPPAAISEAHRLFPDNTHKRNFFLLDLSQFLGKFSERRCDGLRRRANLEICSAHKIGGPKGVGALVKGEKIELIPQLRGGGQEKGRRSGTENVIGIAGFGAAAEAAQRDLDAGVWDGVAELRDEMETALRDCAGDDLIIFGKSAPRLPNTSCFAIPGWKGETQVMQLDLAGFAVSAGSACSSGKIGPSRVLKAMGYDDITASSAIRVSMGPTTTKEEVTRFIDAWTALYKKMKTRAT